jgi:Predicted hydrolases or acyltransferases (alpha/beta hydrolase superfamily)
LEFLEVNGLRLEARFMGPPPGQAATLVFLHEGLGAAGLWRDLPERLTGATGMGALLYSRHGYGRSPRKPRPWPATYLHDEALVWLPRVLEAAGIRRAILVGHSDGASIAAIAAGSGAVPQAEGLVLVAPHVVEEEAIAAGIRRAVAAYEQGDLRRRLARHHDHVDDVFFGWAGAWLDFAAAGWDIRPLLAGIKVPVLAMQGEGDEYATDLHCRAIAAGAGGPVEVCVLPDCGHQFLRDQPEAARDAIAGFIGRVHSP